LAQHSVTHTKNFSTRTRTKYNPHSPRHAASSTRTRTQSSAGSRTRPANAGTRNPRGLMSPAQDSIRGTKLKVKTRAITLRKITFPQINCNVKETQ